MADETDIAARELLHSSVSQAASIRLHAEILSLKHADLDPEVAAGLSTIQEIADELNVVLMTLMAHAEDRSE